MTRRRRSSWLRLGWLALSLSSVVALDVARPVHAQALDVVVEGLLDDNCTALGNGQNPSSDSEFGSNLLAICEFPPTSNGASAGGGAASVQSSTISIQNGVLQRRLRRARDKERDKEEDSETALLFYSGGESANLLADDSSEGSESGLDSRRFNLFVSGAFESLDRDVTIFEDGYDSSIQGGTIGADYRFTNIFVAGVAATYRKQDGDFDGGGDFEMNSFDPMLYASILPTPQTFIQLVAGRNDQEFDVHRNVRFTIERDGGGGTTQLSGVSTSKTDAEVDSAGILFGYDHSVRNFTFGPRLGLNYNKTTIDAFVEDGGTGLELRVAEQDIKSRQGVAGFYGSAAFSSGFGVFVPQLNVEYVREFEDDPSILAAQFVEDLRGPNATTFNYQTNEPDSGFFNVDVGVAAGLAHGIQPYVNLRTMLGNTNFENFVGTVGVRFEL